MTQPINALEAADRGEARVVSIEGGRQFQQKLNQVGIHTGDLIQIHRPGIVGGPVIIQIHGTDVAIGKKMACKIKVELLTTTS